MDYLGKEAVCSVPAMFVVARLLHNEDRPYEDGELQRLLGLGGRIEDDETEGEANASGVLAASLAVGADLNLFSKGTDRKWSLHESVGVQTSALTANSTEGFRDLVCHRLGQRALEAVDERAEPSDVATGAVWMLLQDPFESIAAGWSGSTQHRFEAAGLKRAIGNSTKFRPFQRWFRALGLGSLTAADEAKARILVDPTAAITRSLHRLPVRSSAGDWLSALQEAQPLLCHPRLVGTLPKGTVEHEGLPPSLSLALLKLRKQNRIATEPGADHSDAVTLKLGNINDRIATITVKG